MVVKAAFTIVLLGQTTSDKVDERKQRRGRASQGKMCDPQQAVCHSAVLAAEISRRAKSFKN